MLRNGDLLKVVEQVDRVLLEGYLGLSRGDILTLRRARQALFERRARRGDESP